MNRILQATHFAAEKHSQQRRKNTEASPYINHPIEVAFHLSSVGGIFDEEILIAALLHDTIEDTETSQEEIASLFGETVASLVAECTDDKSLPKSERKRLQIENAPKKSPGAKMIKIADKTCNLRSILSDPPKDWPLSRQYDYFVWAEKVVSGLLGHNSSLDDAVDRVLCVGLRKLKPTEAVDLTAATAHP
jgi:guanosine-3',5'-bis(diphosphate) 3'-pyrophosphohydrolase